MVLIFQVIESPYAFHDARKNNRISYYSVKAMQKHIKFVDPPKEIPSYLFALSDEFRLNTLIV